RASPRDASILFSRSSKPEFLATTFLSCSCSSRVSSLTSIACAVSPVDTKGSIWMYNLVYYDAIYSRKNYENESNKLHQFIQRYKKSAGDTLLDVACGTGNHLKYLKQWYDVEGLDINPTMLKQAKKKHPRITFHRGDMCSFILRKRFAVITCLFSA